MAMVSINAKMSSTSVKLILIVCIAGCFGSLKEATLDQYDNQWHDLVTFVYQKIDGMERMLTEKDKHVEQLRSDLVYQKNEITQLRQKVVSLEREMVYKDTMVDRLEGRVTDVEMYINDTVPYKTKSTGFANVNTDFNLLRDKIPDNYQSLANATANTLHNQDSFHLSVNETYESLLRQDEKSSSRSRVSQKTSKQNISKAAIPRMFHKRITPSSQSPGQRVAFHSSLATDRKYHEDNTVVYDHKKLDHGNGYNPFDGIYTVPESGTYVITWTSLCYGNQQFQTVLAVNGAYAGSSWTDAEVVNDVHQTTAVVVVALHQGDRVLIRMGSTYGHGNILSRTNFGESTFSGWKLD
ncbi:uncharacterized protein [Argopecten irradians]|uniref:uncharacterized protein n=1 Tax=Argopecten irradians TaxID=31199 RepID=UPI003712F203